MNFPTILYRVPGPHRKPRTGVMYATHSCEDADEFAELSAKGWHASIEEASGAETAKEVIYIVAAADEAAGSITPETREELEAQAKELGLSFNRRTRDEVLVARIAEALA